MTIWYNLSLTGRLNWPKISRQSNSSFGDTLIQIQEITAALGVHVVNLHSDVVSCRGRYSPRAVHVVLVVVRISGRRQSLVVGVGSQRSATGHWQYKQKKWRTNERRLCYLFNPTASQVSALLINYSRRLVVVARVVVVVDTETTRHNSALGFIHVNAMSWKVAHIRSWTNIRIGTPARDIDRVLKPVQEVHVLACATFSDGPTHKSRTFVYWWASSGSYNIIQKS